MKLLKGSQTLGKCFHTSEKSRVWFLNKLRGTQSFSQIACLRISNTFTSTLLSHLNEISLCLHNQTHVDTTQLDDNFLNIIWRRPKSECSFPKSSVFHWNGATLSVFFPLIRYGKLSCGWRRERDGILPGEKHEAIFFIQAPSSTDCQKKKSDMPLFSNCAYCKIGVKTNITAAMYSGFWSDSALILKICAVCWITC